MNTQLTTIGDDKVALIKRTIRDEKTGCLLWQGAKSRGYGVVERAGINRLVHRLVMGAPKGSVVRHSCDNPSCINPDHLTIGTQAENIADAVERGRIATGMRLPQTKLTPSEVAEIRIEYAKGGISQEDLGLRYGVTQMTVSRIVRNKQHRTHGDI